MNAYRLVDESVPDEYLAAFQVWIEALQKINAMGLTFGDQSIPIENFEIDGSWHVEFEVALWWQVEQEVRGQ
ncbi:MAG: hypothetical protein K8T89_10155 [Planctomycetes bacterium]|nr:hypothetical protein [Planctomycetota bacterium]